MDQCLSPQSNYECTDPNFEGYYCEVPVDYCSTLGATSCDNVDLCEYTTSLNSNRCVYSRCFAFDTEDECVGINETNYAHSNITWDTFCEWVTDGSDQYCNRVTCGEELPKCKHGSVRKPLLNEYNEVGEQPRSICDAWYCDCTTVTDVDNQYWIVSEEATLLGLLVMNINMKHHNRH